MQAVFGSGHGAGGYRVLVQHIRGGQASGSNRSSDEFVGQWRRQLGCRFKHVNPESEDGVKDRWEEAQTM